jgi:large subunit ribosomal protein L25
LLPCPVEIFNALSYGRLSRFSCAVRILLAALFFHTNRRRPDMTGIVINVDVRERTGTGGARQTRREGMVPGILYGGDKAPVAIATSAKDLLRLIRSGKFMAHMIDLQWDPVSDLPVHFDLYRVEEGSVISVEVPVHFENQDTCPGIKKGGTLNVVRHTVGLDVPAGMIPEELTVDLAKAEIGDVIHISAVRMPDGARPSIRDRDFTVATIVGRGGKQEATEEAAT